jgi:peptide deformylase
MAANMIGVHKRILVFSAGIFNVAMINPVILETAGEQKGSEGCLSVPGKAGEVTRPNYVKARALGRDMKEFEVEGVGLLARAICHELDHLDGIVYVTRVEGELYSVAEEEEQQQ